MSQHYDSGGIPDDWKPPESPPLNTIEEIRSAVEQMLGWHAHTLKLSEAGNRALHEALNHPTPPAGPARRG